MHCMMLASRVSNHFLLLPDRKRIQFERKLGSGHCSFGRYMIMPCPNYCGVCRPSCDC